MAFVTSGIFCIQVKYLHKPKNRLTWHFKRRVPQDLFGHYKSKTLLRSLRTQDKKKAVSLCEQINDHFETEFDRLRRGLPKEPLTGAFSSGQQRLKEFGIELDVLRKLAGEYREEAIDMVEPFQRHIENILFDVLGNDVMERLHHTRSPWPLDELPAADEAAMKLIRGELRLKASEYPKEYIRLKRRDGDKKFCRDIDNAISFLLKYLPDKAPAEYRRYELNDLIKQHMDAGLKTTSIHRRINTLRAMFNKVTLELELHEDANHVFIKPDIPNLGEDVTERRDFTFDQLNVLRKVSSEKNKEIIWLIHLMLETGLRVKECCGLKKSDIFLEDPHPYLVVCRNPFRRLKNKSSRRFVPLVGVALKAAQETIEVNADEEWFFPRYINKLIKETKNATASASVNKRIKVILGSNAPTCHSFRHTFQSRLKDVECPEQLRNEICGWAKKTSEKYGSPTDIKIKQRYLLESISAREGVGY